MILKLKLLAATNATKASLSIKILYTKLFIRTEHGIVVWELAQSKLADKPTFEIGNGDHCTSLAWLYKQPSLVAGLGAKIIKIFDARSNMKAVNQTVTKASKAVILNFFLTLRKYFSIENENYNF